MQPRRIARELALLSMGQLPSNSDQLANQDLQAVMIVAVHTLVGEVQEALETASAELRRGSDRILDSELKAIDIQSARAMITESIDLTQMAINRLGLAIEFPEFIQLANQQSVRDYTLELITVVHHHRADIDQVLEQSLVDWQLHRLAHIDANLLRLTVAEMMYLDIPHRVAINEAVELAKKYSAEDGHRFINGVLRRVTYQIARQ
ncbi:MAG: transcription antitermination protein NusB [Acaryochloris sp. RU_4_1]|nr:transcription antitermination protein NusB [Acaryochloris sp. SU_5_25]NJM66981.1 transcription antitermination protein NusB [Acaryochloris sp. RU_4_1]NJR55857.1 transcription antitermination protein NusB [Acaryochloris sp. CRU_2_0]